MTDEQINVTIAETCGWKETEPWLNGNCCFERSNDPCGYRIEDLPDYCADLNAMHEAEKVLTEHQCESIYPRMMGAWRNPTKPIYATARQRAEAFLRTLGKWEEVQA